MTHYAVLRHNFDIQHNPDRLGPGYDDEKFWLSVGSGGDSRSWLVGNLIWLISWEGFMKTHHVVSGWYKVDQVGKRAGVEFPAGLGRVRPRSGHRPPRQGFRGRRPPGGGNWNRR